MALSDGAIIGIAVGGGILGLILLVGLYYWMCEAGCAGADAICEICECCDLDCCSCCDACDCCPDCCPGDACGGMCGGGMCGCEGCFLCLAGICCCLLPDDELEKRRKAHHARMARLTHIRHERLRRRRSGLPHEVEKEEGKEMDGPSEDPNAEQPFDHTLHGESTASRVVEVNTSRGNVSVEAQRHLQHGDVQYATMMAPRGASTAVAMPPSLSSSGNFHQQQQMYSQPPVTPNPTGM